MHNQESAYKYDLAFSFTYEDEPLAEQLYNLLKGRLSCFIYFEKQDELAGRDGEDVFNRVFSKESRVVAILYSEKWGETKWTRIEQTAIKNRGYDEGYDFVILIPTKANLVPPKWLPKTKIWVGLERWGIEGAASNIESKVLEFNGTIKTESIADQVSREEREIREKAARERLLDSGEGLRLAFGEMRLIATEIQKFQIQIKSQSFDWHFIVRDNDAHGVDVISHGFYLTFRYSEKYNNSTDGAKLSVELWDGIFDARGYATDPFSKTIQISESILQFDINQYNQNGWSEFGTKKNFTSSVKLAEKWVGDLIKVVGQKRKSNNY
jgi:hypothetical protein